MRPNATPTKSLGIKLPARLTGLPESGVLLGLDVSSTATGWAVYHLHTGEWGASGLIKPPARLSALERIDLMVEALKGHIAELEPALCILEWSDGRTAGRLGKATGLHRLGAAQYAALMVLREAGCPVETVGENTWTRRVPKAKRGERLRETCPAYAGYWGTRDRGLDVADAFGLVLWRLAQVR
jgi:hypothetical protein